MGVYNDKEGLERAVESILKQSYGDFEFIICDDGSADGSLKLLKILASQDSRIVLFENQKNMGLPYTLNRCLSLARAKYIARMDADDESLPERFAEQITFLEAHPEIAILGTAINFFDKDGIWGKLEYPLLPQKKDFLLRSPFCHPSIMMRKEVLEELGGYSSKKKTGRSEDYDLFMRLYVAGYTGANLPAVLLNYYEARDSFSKRKFRWTFTEAGVRWRGYRALGLMPAGIFWALKPIAIGLIPVRLWRAFRRRFFNKQSHD